MTLGLAGLGALVGCEERPSPPGAPTATAAPSVVAASPRCEGREVVALVGGPRFLRGQVVACAGDRVTLAYGRGLRGKPRPQREVATASLFDVRPTVGATEGAVGACHFGKERWVICRVDKAEKGRYRVDSDEGQRREIDPDAFVAVTGAAAELIEQHLAGQAAGRAFDEAVRQSRFANPAPAEVGQLVVAPRIDTSFYDGKVVEVGPDEVTIAWPDASWPKRKVPRHAIGRPAKPPLALAVGQLVLWRPHGDTDRWRIAKVTALDDPGYTLEDRNGESAHRDNVDLIPFAMP
ncbi:MAG: hypothetical protein KC731_41650 [Myxococcales bacterium]|nr:hypothetical protein [Myxococcales bacterium]